MKKITITQLAKCLALGAAVSLFANCTVTAPPGIVIGPDGSISTSHSPHAPAGTGGGGVSAPAAEGSAVAEAPAPESPGIWSGPAQLSPAQQAEVERNMRDQLARQEREQAAQNSMNAVLSNPAAFMHLNTFGAQALENGSGGSSTSLLQGNRAQRDMKKIQALGL